MLHPSCAPAQQRLGGADGELARLDHRELAAGRGPPPQCPPLCPGHSWPPLSQEAAGGSQPVGSPGADTPRSAWVRQADT